jgi:SWI/SNF-related matrix-associated actin-dependent regulator of chromatin subfamily B protein 1
MKMFADLAARPGKVDFEEAKREEILVPIRLEFDVEHHRMREAFVWNLNGR